MTGNVFFVKKDGLYLIGRARNIQKQMRKVKPDEIIAILETDYPLAFEARLLRRYRNHRLPESCYFKFTEKEALLCKNEFGIKGNLPRTLGEEFFIALTASVIILFSSTAILFKLSFLPSFVICLSLFFSSFPMLLLFFLGDFGGYNCSDLNLFYSWFNRIRALIVAILLLSLSFFIWKSYLF